MSCCGCKEEKFKELADVISQFKNEPGPLMPVMQKAQEIFGCLDYETQDFISKQLNIPMSEIYGVATFYSLFSLESKGKNIIRVCLGTACYVKGSQALIERLSRELDVEIGKTTKDGRFTLEATRCIGACGLAPAMMINDKVYGRLTPEDIPKILEEYK